MIDLTLDYHSHILPGCDHGSDCIATSLKQIAMAKEAGIRTICATPHFYPHQESTESFLARRQKCRDLLIGSMNNDYPRIELGAEVLICEGMERMKELESLCREGTNELLLEMPFYKWQEAIWDTLFRLSEIDDIQIIIAHADRYPVENINRLIESGIPLQLNIDCLLNLLRRKRYLTWIKSGYVQYVGSDIHMLGSEYSDWQTCAKLLKKYQ